MREVAIAKEVIIAYLSKEININNLNAIRMIQESDMYLLNHVKALLKIFERAKEELESETR